MKYAQLVMGLLIGTALGGAVVGGLNTGSMGNTAKGASLDKTAIQDIVRETIDGEGERIMQAVSKHQQAQQKQRTAGASEALKSAEVKNDIYHDEGVAFAGPHDAERVVAEFFDYNCPACKMQYKALAELLEKDKNVKVVFHEYPIFGPQSETNSKIGLAVFYTAPQKYLAFHEKMMGNEGRTDEATAYSFVKDIGLNVEKVKELANSSKVKEALEKSRALGGKMGVQGTPSVFIGEEMIPHAVSFDEIEARLSQTK